MIASGTIGTTYWVYERDFFGDELLVRYPLVGGWEVVNPRRFPRTVATLLGEAERKAEK